MRPRCAPRGPNCPQIELKGCGRNDEEDEADEEDEEDEADEADEEDEADEADEEDEAVEDEEDEAGEEDDRRLFFHRRRMSKACGHGL